MGYCAHVLSCAVCGRPLHLWVYWIGRFHDVSHSSAGSFVQVDEAKNKVEEVGEGRWRSEFERPIYFVEMRDGYTCCWCSMRRDSIVLQPHPLSPASVRVLRHPQE